MGPSVNRQENSPLKITMAPSFRYLCVMPEPNRLRRVGLLCFQGPLSFLSISRVVGFKQRGRRHGAIVVREHEAH